MEFKQIRMIVLDLDQTLLRTDKSISPYTRQTLLSCRQRGIRIAFATARPLRGALPFAQAIPCDALIYHNGAQVHCGQTLLHTSPIPIQDAQRILLALARDFPQINLAVEIDDTLYANFDVSVYWGAIPAIQSDFSNLPNRDADKIIAGAQTQAEVDAITSYLPNELYAEFSEGRLGLIMHKNATKLNGLCAAGRQLGIALDEMIAFGDDLNDIEMLRACGLGIAMGNAHPDVKAAADVITLSNDADGVAVFLQKHLLGG